MNESKSSPNGLVTGLVLGAAVGAGLTLLFGTKKGKELQKNLRSKYPELFDKLDGVVVDVKEGVSDGYDSVSKQVTSRAAGVKNAVSEKLGSLGKAVGLSNSDKRFKKSGKKL